MSSPAPREPLTLLAVSVTVLAWASAFIGIRAVGEDISPGALALGIDWATECAEQLPAASSASVAFVLVSGPP